MNSDHASVVHKGLLATHVNDGAHTAAPSEEEGGQVVKFKLKFILTVICWFYFFDFLDFCFCTLLQRGGTGNTLCLSVSVHVVSTVT